MKPYIAIDPGSAVTGVSIAFPAAPLLVGKINAPTVDDAMTLLTWCRVYFSNITVVVEAQHLPRDPKRLHWPRLLKLILSAHRWVVCAEMLGLKIDQVMPSQWQGPMLAPAPKTKDGKKLSTKQRGKIIVARTWGNVRRFESVAHTGSAAEVPSEKLPHDICDAMLLGRWWGMHGGGKP